MGGREVRESAVLQNCSFSFGDNFSSNIRERKQFDWKMEEWFEEYFTKEFLFFYLKIYP
jgi:hypothetical protein